MAQYYSEPNSDLTIQQAVVASIGNIVPPANVAITTVKTSPTSTSAIYVGYTLTAPSASFASTAAAYTAYSDALTKSIAAGDFTANIEAFAAANGAIYLAASSLVPQQVIIQNGPFNLPTVRPTAAPSLLPGGPTSLPSNLPSSSPTQRPTLVPTFAVGKPTPGPSVGPTIAPTAMPTAPAAHLIVSQVRQRKCIELFFFLVFVKYFLLILISHSFLFFCSLSLASLWPSIRSSPTAP